MNGRFSERDHYLILLISFCILGIAVLTGTFLFVIVAAVLAAASAVVRDLQVREDERK